MRRSTLAAFVALAVAVTLAACAPVEAPRSTPSPTIVDGPTPEATPEARVIPPGEKPPSVFGGDCSTALSTATLESVTGMAFALESSNTDGDVGNVGGLGCSWESPSGGVRIEILPVSGLNGAEFPADQVEYYFEACDPSWVCSYRSRTSELWISASFQLAGGMTREQIDRWGTAISSAIEQSDEAAGAAIWTRDRNGWWPTLDCQRVGESVAAGLDAELTAQAGGYVDPPLPGVVLAGVASNWSNCYLEIPDSVLAPIDMYTSAGAAWALPHSPEDTPFDLGVEGVTVYRDSGHESVYSAGYSLTDGVNQLVAYVPTDGPWTDEEIMTAIAHAAVAGWE